MENVIATKELKGGATKQVIALRDEFVIRTIFTNGAAPHYFKKYFRTKEAAVKIFNQLIAM